MFPKATFDDLVQLAARLCHSPIAAVTLTDEHGHWLVAGLGLPMCEVGHGYPFFDRIMQNMEKEDATLVVPDARHDARFEQDDFVADEPHIRLLVSVPLTLVNGEVVGALSVMDTEARAISQDELNSLQRLARQANFLVGSRFATYQESDLGDNPDDNSGDDQTQTNQSTDRFFYFTTDLLGIAHLDGRFKRVNRAFHETLAFSAEELLSKSFIDLVMPEQQAQVLNEIQKFPDTDVPIEFECKCMVRDGSFRRILWVTLPVAEQDLVYFVGRDVTEVRTLAEKSRLQEARYRHFVENSRDMIWAVDVEGKITYISQAAHRIYGRAPEEMIGHNFLEFVPLEQLELDRETFAETMASGAATDDYVSRSYRKDGSIALMWTRSIVERDADGKAIGKIGIALDMSRQLETEEALRHSEERFRRIFFSSAACIATYHLDGRILQVNPAFCEALGYRSDELEETDFFALIHPEDREKTLALLRQLAAGEIDSFLVEMRFSKKNDGVAWMRAGVSCVYSALERPQYFITIAEDISVQKNAEERLKESESLLRIAGKMARLGAWSVELSEDERQTKVIWSEVVCAIHEVPIGYAPSLDNAIDFYAPEWQETIQTAFGVCVRDGTPYDLEAEIVTAMGNRRWVQAIGRAERDANGVTRRVYGAFQDITLKKLADMALRDSEERFRQMAETIDAVFIIFEPEQGQITYVSPRYEQLFGAASRAELYQDPRNFARHVHPGDLPKLRAAADDISAVQIDFRVRLPDGELLWVELRTFPVQEDDHKPQRVVGLARDITLLTQTTEQLRQSEEQYRLLFDNNPNPMWVYDVATYQFLAVNEAAIKHYGFAEAEFMAFTLHDIQLQEVNSTQLAKWETQEKEHRQRVVHSWRHRTKDGAIIDVEETSDIIAFNGRKARIALINDVTARNQAAARVREQAELLDKAQDAIMVRDLSHRITYWNRSAERLYGWGAHEVIGQRVDELLHKDQALYQQAYQQVMATGEWFGELIKYERTGREILVEGRWTLVRDDEGAPQAILAINTDVTERKQLEMQFLRAQRMESIGTLAGGIAHDLNNVLAPILLSLGMLKRQARTETETKLLNLLENSAKHGAGMVRQVLAFARGVEGERTVVDVAELLRDLEVFIRDTFDRNIQVQVKIDEPLPTILADATQIHQVLLNLAVNARDAMPAGGTLEIGAAAVTLDPQYAALERSIEAGQYIMLRISDTGMGIPKAVREQIFDPFFTTKEVGKGTGLGLTTVQSVVKSHGGFINVYSEEGHGTEFKLYLRAFGTEINEDGATVAEDTMQRGHGERILVVDDDVSVLTVIQQTLEVFGYRVLTAENGADAVAIFAQQSGEIDVVLTDMMMPIMDGFATIRALRRINPQVKIIVASGMAANNVITQAFNMGIRHFLEKPFTAVALLEVVNAILAEDTTQS